MGGTLLVKICSAAYSKSMHYFKSSRWSIRMVDGRNWLPYRMHQWMIWLSIHLMWRMSDWVYEFFGRFISSWHWRGCSSEWGLRGSGCVSTICISTAIWSDLLGCRIVGSRSVKVFGHSLLASLISKCFAVELHTVAILLVVWLRSRQRLVLPIVQETQVQLFNSLLRFVILQCFKFGSWNRSESRLVIGEQPLWSVSWYNRTIWSA